MPGVMLDLGAEELSFASDAPSPIYNSSSPLCSPLPLSHSRSPHSMMQSAGAVAAAATRRSASFNAKADVYSQLAPLTYGRSQSLINTASIPQSFNSAFYSLPSTPGKLSDMAMLEGLDDLQCGDSGPGMDSAVFGGLDSSVLQGGNFILDTREVNNLSGRMPPTSPTTSLENAQMLTALQKFLLNNNSEDDESWAAVDVYACDEFRMFEFKVRRCMRGRSHDWTECPFAHPGEKARRRDPRRFHYSGTACPDFRKGSCRRGDACEFAHGVFECWLHPARYRTQPCKDGRSCRRRVCFFAHTQEQLRLLPGAAQAASVARNVLGGSSGAATALAACLSQSGSFDGGISFDGSSRCLAAAAHSFDGSSQYGFSSDATGHCCNTSQVSSPTSTLVGHTLSPPPLSPPLSPSASPVSPPSPHHWPNSLVHSLSNLAMAQNALSQAASYSQPLSEATGLSQAQASFARAHSSQQAMAAAVVAAAASQGMVTPAHRRHLDRLNSMPALSIPSAADHYSHRGGLMQSVSSPLSSPGSGSPPSPGPHSHSHGSSKEMSDLIATLQHLDMRGGGGVSPLWLQAQSAQAAQVAQVTSAAAQYSSGPSPLRRCSQSVPVTPTKLRWDGKEQQPWEVPDNEDEEQQAGVQRCDGRDLRSKMYGSRMIKDNRMDAGEAPDLGWVTDLVQEDSEQSW